MHHVNPAQAQLGQFLQLQPETEIGKYFISNKNDLSEALTCTAYRIAHFFKTFVWISDHQICDWAASHQKEKISSLFEGKSIQRKLIRYENDMVVPKQSILETIWNAIKFIFEFITHPTTVGAILPSSIRAAREMVREIPKDLKAQNRLILEVGPGTGVFTDKIIKRMNPSDELHLVEYDSEFCQQLRKRYQHIPNVKIFERSILNHPVDENKKYNFIVTSLPLNVFEPGFVNGVFKKFEEFAAVNCKLSYIEYLVISEIKMLFSNAANKSKMNAIFNAKNEFYKKHEFRKAKVLLNFPPTNVIHHRLNPE